MSTLENYRVGVVVNYSGEFEADPIETLLISNPSEYSAAVARIYTVLEAADENYLQPRLRVLARPGAVSNWLAFTRDYMGVYFQDAANNKASEEITLVTDKKGSHVSESKYYGHLSSTSPDTRSKNDGAEQGIDTNDVEQNTTEDPDESKFPVVNLSDSIDEGKEEPSVIKPGRARDIVKRPVLRKPSEKIHVNPFVMYLNTYNTTGAGHAQAYEEYSKSSETDPLAIETKAQQYLLEVFTRENIRNGEVRSVILTGNAGDGKTRLCRLVWESLSDRNFAEAGRELKDSEIDLLQECGKKVKIIKDLSDWDVPHGIELLKEMAGGVNANGDPTVYLIAANEGRLRNALQDPSLWKLREQIEHALDGTPLEEGPVVLNLNQVSTSTFVLKLIDKMTAPQHWEACQGCPALNYCPIKWNRDKLASTACATPSIGAQRLHELYRIIEQLGKHITFRDALIHLTYSLNGRFNCYSVQAVPEDHRPLFALWVYYRNCYGDEADRDFQNNGVAGILRRFDIGAHSNFKVDELILKGHLSPAPSQVKQIEDFFKQGVDLGGEADLFIKARQDYLERQYTAVPAKNKARRQDVPFDLLRWWLPHIRRKFYFEWPDNSEIDPFLLIPFKSFNIMRQLLTGKVSHLELNSKKENLVIALNQAFAEIFIKRKDILYLSSRTGFSNQLPVPVIRNQFLSANVGLEKEELSPDLVQKLDRVHSNLVLSIPIQKGEPVKLFLNLLIFEYLWRIQQGGTLNYMKDECGLAITKFQEELLTRANDAASSAKISVFAYDQSEFVIKSLSLTNSGKLEIL